MSSILANVAGRRVLVTRMTDGIFAAATGHRCRHCWERPTCDIASTSLSTYRGADRLAGWPRDKVHPKENRLAFPDDVKKKDRF